MTKRTYNRRTDDEIIAELQGRIHELERRMVAKQRPDAQVMKDFQKVKKTLAKFSQTCMDNGRQDLSNSILAFLTSFELQAKEAPAEQRRAVGHP